MAEVNRVAVAAAMAKRPKVRFVIMVCISVVGCTGQKTFSLTANGLETKNPTK
jgi:hypothetical protein